MTPLTPTEIEELRIAIAEEMGIENGIEDVQFWKSGYWSAKKLPPYTTSIDAIQAACFERFTKGTEASEFSARLEWLLKFENHGNHLAFAMWQLTPLDWCIAFAMTAKIWRYKV
jgi:hypothetical protein